MSENKNAVTLINPGGRAVEVMPEHADALLADPNSGFKVAPKGASGIVKPDDPNQGKPPEAAAPAAQDRVKVSDKAEGTQDEDLMKLQRKELNNIASDLGVEYPDKLPSKEEVVKAINEKRGGDEPASPEDRAQDAREDQENANQNQTPPANPGQQPSRQ